MAVNTATVGPGKLTIGSLAALTNFSSQIRAAKIVPNVSKGDPLDVLSGESVPGDRDETFTLDVTLLSDFGHDSSTTEWLWEHRGEVHPFEYVPNNALGRNITGQLVVEPIEIGGDVKSKPAADVSFDLMGPPAFGDSA